MSEAKDKEVESMSRISVFNGQILLIRRFEHEVSRAAWEIRSLSNWVRWSPPRIGPRRSPSIDSIAMLPFMRHLQARTQALGPVFLSLRETLAKLQCCLT